MPRNPPGILLLEDNEWDAKVVREALGQNDETKGFPIARAASLREAERLLDTRSFVLILADLNVGDSRGLDTVHKLVARVKGKIPIVVLTGSVGDQMGLAAVQEGATDFIGKDTLNARRLALSVRFAIERTELARLAVSSERNQSLAESNGQLMNAVAHELNNPLTPMSLQFHLLKSGYLGPLNEQQARSMELLDRNLNRLTGLIRDVLDIGRLTGGTFRLRPAPCDLAGVIRETHQTYAPLADQQGVRLILAGMHRLPAVADSTRITQVLFNLVSNALKYTPNGGYVSLSCTVEEAEAVIRVTDTGIGVTAQQISKLFQPFSQVHTAEGGQKPGSGLGLFISKGIVEAHGGTLWCESEGPGKGTTFGLKFPLEPTGVHRAEARLVATA